MARARAGFLESETLDHREPAACRRTGAGTAGGVGCPRLGRQSRIQETVARRRFGLTYKSARNEIPGNPFTVLLQVILLIRQRRDTEGWISRRPATGALR